MLTLLISVLALIRKLRIEPDARPTFRSETIARALNARSGPMLLTVMSQFATCHTARASSWARAIRTPGHKTRIAISAFLNNAEIIGEYFETCTVLYGRVLPGNLLTIRASYPSPDNFVNIPQRFQQWTQASKRQHVRPIRKRPLRRVVHFHEHRINPASDTGT